MKKDFSQKRNNRKITILSTCEDPWGGSEELWALSIPHFQKKGFSVTVLKEKISHEHPKIVELKAEDVRFKELFPLNRRGRLGIALRGLYKLTDPNQELSVARFKFYLKRRKPSVVIISQGINFDGLLYARVCQKETIPYVIVSQKAVDFLWPQNRDRSWMRNTFQQAELCFFVSSQNKTLTEEQFGFRFSNAKIISNPITLAADPLPYPSTKDGFKLACIGRLFIIDKGQDILFRVLSMEKWKQRNLHLSLVGTGKDEDGLRELANLLDLKNVTFLGFKNNIQEIWLHHHALVLPSRSEGLPLVVLEAMAAGRTVITTHAGGSAEVLSDGETGFIGQATAETLDRTLERAWKKRHDWKQMGLKANKYIINNIPNAPETEFANEVMAVVNG